MVIIITIIEFLILLVISSSKARPNAVDQFSHGRFVWLPKPKTCIWFCLQLGTNVAKHIWVNFLLFSKKNEFHISTSHIKVNCVCTHLNWTCFILSSFQFRWFHGGSVSGVPSFYLVLAGRGEENLERLPLAAERNETYQATMIGLENDLLSNCMHDQKYSPRTGLLTPIAIVTCLYSIVYSILCIKTTLHACTCVHVYIYICILNNTYIYIYVYIQNMHANLRTVVVKCAATFKEAFMFSRVRITWLRRAFKWDLLYLPLSVYHCSRLNQNPRGTFLRLNSSLTTLLVSTFEKVQYQDHIWSKLIEQFLKSICMH